MSQVIQIVCEQGHTQKIRVPDMSQAEAQQYAGLLDGTSALYQYPPRTHPIPGSVIGKCGICQAWLTATVEEEGVSHAH